MYARPAFAEPDLDRIAALVAAHPFGLLVTAADGLDASPVPFTVTRQGDGLLLEGHLAAGNPQCARIAAADAALAVFGGPHAYVSPSWYRTQPAVPTWDYAAVHVHGALEPMTDAGETRAMLRGLSAHDPDFDMDALPADYLAGMLRGIRAFRLRSTRIEAQWKMSQNRSVADRQGVIAALRAQGSEDVAALVEATLP
ncbi:MAG TPA: FMN-binding negative transcriptional regulator [Acetobacteraceae bacterium]|nr:FMN-binding negative transcriptional regulator [Acetobacteraceae bacterium]